MHSRRTMRSWPGLVGVLVLALLSASDVRAEPDVYVERPIAVTAHAGLGAPLGLLGIAVDVAVQPWLGIEGGIGFGATGTQLAVNGRARILRVGRDQLAIGAGVSGGRYEHRDPFYGIEYEGTMFGPAVWANGEVSLERRTSAGVQLRFYAGAAVVVAGDRERCSDLDGEVMCRGSVSDTWIPYLGLSLGYALEL